MKKIILQDKLYPRAKSIVLNDKNCSISYIQRKLQIGYSRAGRIVELLETNHVISTADKNGIRKVI